MTLLRAHVARRARCLVCYTGRAIVAFATCDIGAVLIGRIGVSPRNYRGLREIIETGTAVDMGYVRSKCFTGFVTD